MEKEEILKVVLTLTGNVEPCADTAIDEKREENMKKLIFVFDELHTIVDNIAYNHKDTTYASVRRIVSLCDLQLNNMGIMGD